MEQVTYKQDQSLWRNLPLAIICFFLVFHYTYPESRDLKYNNNFLIIKWSGKLIIFLFYIISIKLFNFNSLFHRMDVTLYNTFKRLLFINMLIIVQTFYDFIYHNRTEQSILRFIEIIKTKIVFIIIGASIFIILEEIIFYHKNKYWPKKKAQPSHLA
jgi:hypothetical protein